MMIEDIKVLITKFHLNSYFNKSIIVFLILFKTTIATASAIANMPIIIVKTSQDCSYFSISISK
jgi:hypothetical protein